MVEYTGPIIDKDEADLRYEGKPITYLFGIGDGTRVIDGHGTAMFINHSCDANCETEEIDGHVWIIALRDIAAGEELCYDYRLYDGDEEDAPCNCGAKTCRGSMFSPEELKRRKRAGSEKQRPNRRRRYKPAKKTAQRKQNSAQDASDREQMQASSDLHQQSSTSTVQKSCRRYTPDSHPRHLH